jgi:threonine dehydratase
LAYAARANDIPCQVFMPLSAPIAKVEAASALGARIELGGETVDDALAAALARSEEAGLAFVHPFADLDVIAGQGSLGLELLEQVPDLIRVIVPVGGGGLVSGTAIAIKSQHPKVEVIGVQVAACAPVPASLTAGRPIAVDSALTIADGIAVKHPSELTLALIERWVDDVVVVPEDDVAEAMVFLMERAKLVVEGAGAVGAAALLGGHVSARGEGTTVVVLSGGNVDAGLLALVARRHETAVGRRLRVFTLVADRPGGLAALLLCIAATGANLLGVTHVREAADLQVRQTGVELTLETRGAEHAESIIAAMTAAGYPVERV